jgi:hypothetical protein
MSKVMERKRLSSRCGQNTDNEPVWYLHVERAFTDSYPTKVARARRWRFWGKSK